MNLKSLMPGKNFEAEDFFRELYKAQREFGPTHEAVQATLNLIDPNFEHALERNPEEAFELVTNVKLFLDNHGYWEKSPC